MYLTMKHIEYSFSKKNIIILITHLTDFNCKLDNLTDKNSKILKSIISQLGLVDLWKNKHDNAERFTLCDAADIPKSRIDYVFKYYINSQNPIASFTQNSRNSL